METTPIETASPEVTPFPPLSQPPLPPPPPPPQTPSQVPPLAPEPGPVPPLAAAPHQTILSYGGYRGAPVHAPAHGYGRHRGVSRGGAYRGAFRGRGQPWNRGGGGRGRGGFRNMSLVVDNSVTGPVISPTVTTDHVPLSSASIDEAGTAALVPAGPADIYPEAETTKIAEPLVLPPRYVSTVSKGGMSLVNTEIYESDTYQALLMRANAMRAVLLERRKQKMAQASAERFKHLLETRIARAVARYDDCNRLTIGDEVFAVTRGGNKLVPVTARTYELLEAIRVLKKQEGTPKPFTADLYDDQPEAVPETTEGETLVTPTVLKSDLLALKSKVVHNNRSYKRLKNGCLKLQGPPILHVEKCKYFTRTGLCSNGKTCKFGHDPRQIALCRAFLKSSCTAYNCFLSHNAVPENTPSCKYLVLGSCTNVSCMYVHNAIDHAHPRVCRAFAVGGWCDQGVQCLLIHSFDCPDFQESGGQCPRGRSCQLSHTLRAVAAAGNAKRPASFRQQQAQQSQEALVLSTDVLGDATLNTFNEKDKVTLILTDSDFSSSEEEDAEDSDMDFEADFIQL